MVRTIRKGVIRGQATTPTIDRNITVKPMAKDLQMGKDKGIRARQREMRGAQMDLYFHPQTTSAMDAQAASPKPFQ